MPRKYNNPEKCQKEFEHINYKWEWNDIMEGPNIIGQWFKGESMKVRGERCVPLPSSR